MPRLALALFTGVACVPAVGPSGAAGQTSAATRTRIGEAAGTPDEAQAGLMQSPGHRANILDRRVTRVGIGIVIGKQVTGTSPLLVTQLFM